MKREVWSCLRSKIGYKSIKKRKWNIVSYSSHIRFMCHGHIKTKSVRPSTPQKAGQVLLERRRICLNHCGSRYVEGWWGFPYLKKFPGFFVSWHLVYWFCFFRFVASWFQSFLVSWFLNFKVSRFNDPILTDYHIMFLMDIDFISKVFKSLLDGSSGFVGAHLF